MRIRTLLVDDESPARARLRGMLESMQDLEIVGEAGDGVEAVEQIEATRPDLVFLDIEMPELSGMEVAASLAPPRPRIVFCTAYDQYAIEAFDQHATDYLLKPVNRGRLEQTVERVRSSLHETQRLRRELQDATRTQERLLPQSLPAMDTLDYAGTCRPAREVGGDYYDFLTLGDGRLGLALADVSGKGVFAGLLMASLQARLQAIAASYDGRLDELAAEINRLTHLSIDANRYATFFYGRYDDTTRELDFVNAGHLPPIVVRRGSTASENELLRLDVSGTVIGLLPDARYRKRRFVFQPGDLFCIFTDGLTETRDAAGKEFGCERLGALLIANADRTADDLTRCVLAELETYAGSTRREDDLTLIVGKVR